MFSVRLFRTTLLASTLALLAGAASAQVEVDESFTLQLEDVPRQNIRLSLEHAVAVGVEHNLQVEVERYSPLIAQENVDVAWGPYDPVLSGEYVYDGRDNPTSSVLAGGGAARFRNYASGGGGGLQALVPYLNATLGLQFDATRTTTDLSFESLSPRYDSGFTIAGSIPLLKNLIWNESWTQIKISGTLLDAEYEAFRGTLMDTVRDIETGYWNVIAQAEQLRVTKKSLQTSLALLDQTQTQYEVGVVSKVDVIEADAGVAQRQLDVIRADARYRTAQDVMLDLVYGTLLEADSRFNIVTTVDPQEYEKIEPDREESVELAFANRPEVARLLADIERGEIQLKFAKNQRLPQLDLSASYGTNGLSGRCIANDGSAACNGSFSDSASDWYSSPGGTEVTAGARFSIPIGNYGARHAVSRSKLELRRSETQILQLRQRIINEVRDDIRLLTSAYQGIHAAERQVAAAAEQLRAERIRMEHGESTPFDVLQREERLVLAEFEKINALQVYRTATSDLDRSTGMSLQSHKIEIDASRELRMAIDRPKRSLWDSLSDPAP